MKRPHGDATCVTIVGKGEKVLNQLQNSKQELIASRTALLQQNCTLKVLLSHTMYSLISFRKSTPPQNRQFNLSISNSKQQVDDLVGGLTF